MNRQLIVLLLITLFFTGCAVISKSQKRDKVADFHYYFDLEEYQKAINSAQRFIVKNPQHSDVPEAWLIIGKCNARLGIFFRTAKMHLSPLEYAEFLKYFDLAEQAYHKIIEEYPQSYLAPIAQLYLGKLYDIDPYGGLNLFDKAVEEYQKVIGKYPASDAARKAQERINIIQSQY